VLETATGFGLTAACKLSGPPGSCASPKLIPLAFPAYLLAASLIDWGQPPRPCAFMRRLGLILAEVDHVQLRVPTGATESFSDQVGRGALLEA